MTVKVRNLLRSMPRPLNAGPCGGAWVECGAVAADLAAADEALPPALEATRNAGAGPWAPSVLAEDARRLAAFKHSREGVPWDEVEAWMKTWGTPQERPAPSPRKL